MSHTSDPPSHLESDWLRKYFGRKMIALAMRRVNMEDLGAIPAKFFRNVKILSKVRQIGSHWVTWVTPQAVTQSGSHKWVTRLPCDLISRFDWLKRDYIWRESNSLEDVEYEYHMDEGKSVGLGRPRPHPPMGWGPKGGS